MASMAFGCFCSLMPAPSAYTLRISFTPDEVCPKLRRCHTNSPMENLRKVTLVSKAENCADLDNARLWIAQKFLCPLKFLTQNKSMWADANTLFKQITEVVRAHTGYLRQSRKTNVFTQIRLNI